MADKFQSEVSALLHSHNVFTRHEKPIPIVKNGRVVCWNSPERFSPDLVGGLVHQINVEVKTGAKSFPFASITEGQMQYARKWRVLRGCEFWFAIFFVLPYPVHGRLKRALFIIPYPILQEAIQVTASIGMKSISYKQEKGSRIAAVEAGLFASEIWCQFELQYDSKRKWYFCKEHPFYKMYLDQEPYLYDTNNKSIEKQYVSLF